MLDKAITKDFKNDVDMSDAKLKSFQLKISESYEAQKTIYENGVGVQSDNWQGSTMTRVIRESCVHFEAEMTLPINNDKGI